MNELSLFSGAGGGLLGTKLLGWKCVGYVEIEEYCQKVLVQRIEDGFLDKAPIFGDIRGFNTRWARRYRGLVDIITAGFPCQPFSVAGKQAGEDDERNMWPETIRTIRRVRPRYCLLENVPGLLGSYLGRILADLAQSGYNARWRMLSAAEVGAPHKRDRLWIVAHAKGKRAVRRSGKIQQENGRQDSHVSRKPVQSSTTMAKPSTKGLQISTCGEFGSIQEENGAFKGRTFGGRTTKTRQWWASEPGLGRVVNGGPNRVDRVKALGNMQVPVVATTVWSLLTQGLI